MKPGAGVCSAVCSKEKPMRMCCFHSSISMFRVNYLTQNSKTEFSVNPFVQVILTPHPCHMYLYLCTFYYSLTRPLPQRNIFALKNRYPEFLNFSSEKIKTLTSHKLTAENVNVTLFPKPLSPLNASWLHRSSPDLPLPAPSSLLPAGTENGAGRLVKQQVPGLILVFGT